MKHRYLSLLMGAWLTAGIMMSAAVAQEGAGGLSPLQTGKDVAEGVGSAVTEVGSAVKSGSGDVVEQGRQLWQDAILPMLQRTTAALPVLAKAIVLLIGFWIVARLAGAAVAKLLGLTRLDDKAVKDWGLEGLLRRPDGSMLSVEGLIGGAVKWIILLFGLVAFFNALDLDMVAGPLQGIIDRIVGVLPNLLKAAVILFVYWALASVVRVGLKKGLSALKFDERAGRYLPGGDEAEAGRVAPSEQISKLFFYVILLFGIPPFLQALGQEALVAPLQDMLTKALSFIPNIFAAALILIVGNVVAVIVREVVSSVLGTVGADQFADRVGVSAIFGKQKLSGIAALLVYVFILVPIVISSLDALQIKAISLPLQNMLGSILTAIPNILLAMVILFIGYAVAKFVRGLVQSLLSGLGIDTLPQRLGLSFLTPKDEKQTLSAIVATIVMVIVLLLTAQQALASLGFEQLAALADRFVQYLPNLFVGIIILLAALSLGRYVGGLVKQAAGSSPSAGTLGSVARYAIIFLGAGMALDELGVSEQIVTVAVQAVLFGSALAIGLAFGLGGQAKAKSIVEQNNDYLNRA